MDLNHAEETCWLCAHGYRCIRKLLLLPVPEGPVNIHHQLSIPKVYILCGHRREPPLASRVYEWVG